VPLHKPCNQGQLGPPESDIEDGGKKGRTSANMGWGKVGGLSQVSTLVFPLLDGRTRGMADFHNADGKGDNSRAYGQTDQETKSESK